MPPFVPLPVPILMLSVEPVVPPAPDPGVAGVPVAPVAPDEPAAPEVPVPPEVVSVMEVSVIVESLIVDKLSVLSPLFLLELHPAKTIPVKAKTVRNLNFILFSLNG